MISRERETAPAPAPPHPGRGAVRLRTLGDLCLEDADGRTLLRRRGTLVLLAYLSRRTPRRVPRAELATLLWGEREEGKARQSLRQALLELKRHVGSAIDITPDFVALAEGAVELDLAELERDASEGRDRAAVERWTGDFLPGAEESSDGSLHAWIEVDGVAPLSAEGYLPLVSDRVA